MTTIEVIQADRDAAADVEEQTIIRSTPYTEGMRAGKFDDALLVQAFARHRQQHATPALIEAEEVERIAALLSEVEGLNWTELCAYEADEEADLCDSSTCVAAHYEDHDPEISRSNYRAMAKAAIRALSTASPPRSLETADVREALAAIVTCAFSDGKLAGKTGDDQILAGSDDAYVNSILAVVYPQPSTPVADAGMVLWRSMDSAPQDGTEFWALTDDLSGSDLPPFVSKCAWHPSAGFYTDELREPIAWRPFAAAPNAEGER